MKYIFKGCPIHGIKSLGNKTITDKNGVPVKSSFCKRCDAFYMDIPNYKRGISLTKKNTRIINFPNIVPSQINIFTKNFNLGLCKCTGKIFISNIYDNHGKCEKIPMQYCSECDKYYIEKEDYLRLIDKSNYIKQAKLIDEFDILINKSKEVVDNNQTIISNLSEHEAQTVETNKSMIDFEYDDVYEIDDEIDDIQQTEQLDLTNYKKSGKVARAYLESNILYNPYQYLPWYYLFSQKKSDRLLISDEVGLGKTIEAGILIKEQLNEKFNSRILIVCPAFLRIKWQDELKNKFNLFSMIINKKTVEEDIRNIVILPMSQMNNFSKLNLSYKFDMIIVDEVHYFKNSKSIRYQQLNSILDNQRHASFVFMSATPINNSGNDYYSIKRLFGKEHLKTNTTKKQAYIKLPRRTVYDISVNLNQFEQKIYNLTDSLNPFSGTIYRHIGSSCLTALKKYATRNNEVAEELHDLSEEFSILFDEEISIEDFKEIMHGVEIPEYDSKLIALKDLIRSLNDDKIIIFSHYIETIRYLASKLGKDYNVAFIYANKVSDNIPNFNSKNRFDDVKKWFDKQKNKTILICSDSCKEGIDLDAASSLINYDLPFNPSILEQRIGRIDRMTQKSNMKIYNFHVLNTYDDRLHLILNAKLQFINYFSNYGIGNPLNISENHYFLLDNFIRYSKKTILGKCFKFSNDDFKVLIKIFKNINIKLDKNIKHNKLIDLLENNKESIYKWFDLHEQEINKLTDDELQRQKDELHKLLNFPSLKYGIITMNCEFRNKLCQEMMKDYNLRIRLRKLIKDYELKLLEVEETGDPMILSSDDIYEEFLFTCENNIGNNFIDALIINDLEKKGAEVLWE